MSELPPAEELTESLPGDSCGTPNPAPVQTKRKKLRHIPLNIPRVTTLSEPTLAQKICAQCGLQKNHIGCAVSEVLEWEPGGFRVEVTEQQKYACRGCEGEIVIGTGPRAGQSDAGPRTAGGNCGAEDQGSLSAGETESDLSGHGLSASTLGDWMAGAADVLEPIAKRLRARGLQSSHLSLDDTPVRVLDPRIERSQARSHLVVFQRRAAGLL